jgi:hypothetical protein
MRPPPFEEAPSPIARWKRDGMADRYAANGHNCHTACRALQRCRDPHSLWGLAGSLGSQTTGYPSGTRVGTRNTPRVQLGHGCSSMRACYDERACVPHHGIPTRRVRHMTKGASSRADGIRPSGADSPSSFDEPLRDEGTGAMQRTRSIAEVANSAGRDRGSSSVSSEGPLVGSYPCSMSQDKQD